MSSADRLARWTAQRNQPAGHPRPTPGVPGGESPSPVPPTGGTGSRELPSGRTQRVPYNAWLSEPCALDLVRLSFALKRELAAVEADPAAVAKAANYPRLLTLLRLDFRDIRRPRPSALHRIAAAAGIAPAVVDELVRSHPHAISEESPR